VLNSMNGQILSDFMFLEVHWENYINGQMHFFNGQILSDFYFYFFAPVQEILPGPVPIKFIIKI